MRDKCTSVACLERVYSDRIEFLAEWEFADPYCPPNDFPPYPDVWGRRVNGDTFSVYPVPGDAVWVVSATPERKTSIQCFFSGKTTISTDFPSRKYVAYRRQNIHSYNELQLADGSTIRWVKGLQGGGKCYYAYRSYLAKFDAEGDLLRGVMFLIPLDAPYERAVWPYCEGVPAGRDSITQWVAEGYINSLTRLRDGTILVDSGNDFYPFVVRFDENLETQFESPELLIADYEEIHNLPAARNMQERADTIHRFVIERTEEKC